MRNQLIVAHPLLSSLSGGGVFTKLAIMQTDLTPEYICMLQNMSGEQKIRSTMALYWTARKIKAARLREQYPQWTEAQVQAEVKRIFMHAVT